MPGFELLARAESGKEFTVQEVVDRSGQSLRSFYQYFAGKHELLLALFDEAILSTADRLEEQIARESTPLDRLHRFVRRVLPHVPAGAQGPAVEEQSHTGDGRVLPPAADAHQPEASRAFVPLVALLETGPRRGRRGRGRAFRPRSTRKWPG